MKLWLRIKKIAEKYSRSLIALAGLLMLTGFLLILGRNLFMFWFLNKNKLDLLCQNYVVSFKAVYSPIHYWQRFAGIWFKNADSYQIRENQILKIVEETPYFKHAEIIDPAQLEIVPEPGQIVWSDVSVIDGRPFLILTYCFDGRDGPRYVRMELPFEQVVVTDEVIRGFAVIENEKHLGIVTAISAPDWHNYDRLYEPYEDEILRMNAENQPPKPLLLNGVLYRPFDITFTIENSEFNATLYFNEDTVRNSVDMGFLVLTVLLPMIGLLLIVFVLIPKIQGRMFSGDAQVLRLIAQGESATLEFKSSLRWDYVNNALNKDLENVILKSIAAFTNASGGRLIIGVDDSGAILGLTNDYSTLKEPTADYFELHLRNLIDGIFGRDFSARLVHCLFYRFTEGENVGREIAVIDIKESDEPVYVTLPQQGAKTEKFFVRSGNSSRALESLSEINRYIQKRF